MTIIHNLRRKRFLLGPAPANLPVSSEGDKSKNIYIISKRHQTFKNINRECWCQRRSRRLEKNKSNTFRQILVRVTTSAYRPNERLRFNQMVV